MSNKIRFWKSTDGKRERVPADELQIDERDPDRFLTDDEKRSRRLEECRGIVRMLGGWYRGF